MGLVVVVSLFTAIPCAVLIWKKGRRVASVRGGRWAALPWVGVAGLLPGLGGPLVAVSGLVGAFSEVAALDDPNAKSLVLSRGIARAMELGFWPSLLGVVLYFAAFFFVGYGAIDERPAD